ncbi:hypothetical protein KC357_g9156 [Hortaea werneckii]|nr:hypothetical protein KC357_g9156 [Hortaea werneckii]
MSILATGAKNANIKNMKASTRSESAVMNYTNGSASRSQAGRQTLPGMRETLPKMDFEAPIMSYSAVSATAMNAGPAKADPSSQLDSLANPSAP